jgi:predicted PolB exonuclease-like 3'-5' exonuclease
MVDTVIVWDLETVPDVEAAGRMLKISEQTEQQIREAMGKDFPKHPLHKIVCIGALIAERTNGVWEIGILGAPHIGERSEASIIEGFVNTIAKLRPQLASFNGNSFDLPVLRYRAMLNQIPAPGLFIRNYFYRYSEDALDLCDALSPFDGRSNVKLEELCCILKLGSKLDGMDGSKVEEMVAAGRIADVAAYCETDVVMTYQIWLHYQLFRGELTQ